MERKVNVWHDCDPGHDDAFALMYCLASDVIQLVGISSVHGNQTTQKTFANILRILFISGQLDLLDKIPVVCGSPVPSVRPSQLCPEIHGETGLGGIDWKDIDDAIVASGHSLDPGNEPSADIVADEIHKVFTSLGEERLTILVTGCHTNISRYVTKYPEDVATGRIDVSAMGGCVRLYGNTGPWQEFNIQIDPEAFDTVLSSFPPGSVTIAPLDVTHTVLATDEIIDRMAVAAGGRLGETVRKLFCFFKETYRDVFKLPAPPIHDPVAVHYIVAAHTGRVHTIGEPPLPDTALFETYTVKAAVETKGEYTSGAICIERYPSVGQCIPRGHQLRVCDSCDLEAFWSALEDVFSRIGAQSPLSI